MLHTKLREEKRIKKEANKIKKSKEKKEGKNDNGRHMRKQKGKSKFSDKYSERIASIREADEKRKKKNKEV